MHSTHRSGQASEFLPADEASLRRRAALAPQRGALERSVREADWADREHWDFEKLLLCVGKLALKACGLYAAGARNARRIVVREVELRLARLPAAFDAFTILHLSDLHVDRMPDVTELALSAWDEREVDLCVLTGDFRYRVDASQARLMDSLRSLVRGIRTRCGFLGVLGNHDSLAMVPPMEEIGIRMLINEAVTIRRRDDRIRIVGVDDVHTYYTPAAHRALRRLQDGFRIALVHSPEFYDAARRAGVDLYLCGHTHGGQVCLPGGVAIMRNLHRAHAFYRGVWRYGPMVGVTHAGTGVAGLPIRFYTRGELLVLHLRRAETARRSP